MITDQEIVAKIDSKQQMISFIDSSAGGDHNQEAEYLEVVEELEKQNARIIALMKQAEKTDREIKSSNTYIKKTLFGKDGGIGPG